MNASSLDEKELEKKEEEKKGEGREASVLRSRSLGKLHGAHGGEQYELGEEQRGELAIFDARRDKGTRGSQAAGAQKIVRASSSCPRQRKRERESVAGRLRLKARRESGIERGD